MAIANTFEASLMKAIRSLEINQYGLILPAISGLDDDKLWPRIQRADDLRLFALAEGLRRGYDIEEIYQKTLIDKFFLNKIMKLVATEQALIDLRKKEADVIPESLLSLAVHQGFVDTYLSRLTGIQVDRVREDRKAAGFVHTYKMVDTCAGEYDAVTPYFYATFDRDNEAVPTDRKKMLVLGSGPIRIGQGIEFDYCSVHSVWALRELGYEAIIINNNPETVSTDFDTSDRLYFEPLTIDDVRAVIENEKPAGAICQFGGQTAIKLIKAITDMGLPIFGTSADMVDAAEDRKRFDAILESCDVKRPRGTTVFTTDEAVQAAADLGYPVLVRPSYVLGGQGMAIVYSDDEMTEYMRIINLVEQEHPILVDKYLMGIELEVDAVSDGVDVLIPGIMEHLERAGIHSGDSISIFPAYISEKTRDAIIDHTEKLARALNVIGLINIQFILFNDEVYVIEVNPRSSRTVPYISKVTGIPIVNLATKVMMGEKIADYPYGTGLFARYPAVYAIKAPVFSFEKLHDVDTSLGPEMKSTGEVLGLSTTYGEAMFKAMLAAGFRFPGKKSGVLLTVRDSDKNDLVPLADRLFQLGYELYGTGGTANYMNRHGIPCSFARKIEEGSPNVVDMMSNGQIRLLVNTESPGSFVAGHSGFKLRRRAIEQGIATVTSLDTLVAVIDCLERELSPKDLKTWEIRDFAALVSKTRENTVPLNEMPMKNDMLKK